MANTATAMSPNCVGIEEVCRPTGWLGQLALAFVNGCMLRNR